MSIQDAASTGPMIPSRPPDPSFERLNALLDSGGSRAELLAEVRHLCLLSFVVGNERGIAYVVAMDKADEEIDAAAAVTDPEYPEGYQS